MHYLSSVYLVNQPLHVSGIFVAHHQEVYFIYTTTGMYVLCFSVDYLLAGLLLVADGHNYIKCTKADVRLRTPDDGPKGCPKHVE